MPKFKTFLPWAFGLIVFIGLCIRLYHISDNQFLFYDEAMYIGYDRALLNLIAHNPAHNLQELGIIISLIFKTALSMPKPLWFFLLSLRVFFVGPEAWYVARLISCASGLATVVLLFFWAKRYFNSTRIGLLSALILLVLPSHVFYSRLGMQEALSCLLFLSGIYFYTLAGKRRWPLFLSAFLLACVYLTNYRMIISPIFIAFIECFNSVTTKKKLDWQKLLAFCAAFFAVVLVVGILYGGINFYVTFAWMFHQAQDAGSKFSLINFLSYPYDVFALEGFFFACFFWGNFYLLKVGEYKRLLAFGLVLLQMGIFSLAAEKGARYLCVVLPFMAAAAAVMLDYCWNKFVKLRPWVLSAAVLGLLVMLYLSISLSLARTDYEQAVDLIMGHDPQAVIVSTQPLVEGLYVANDKQIIACPNDLGLFLNLYRQGAKYLILDPQAYISWDTNGRRFSPPLDNFLEVALKAVQPIATFPHLNKILLTRFVLDHNEQLLDSLSFLSHANQAGYGQIRVYDLGSVFAALQAFHAKGLL